MAFYSRKIGFNGGRISDSIRPYSTGRIEFKVFRTNSNEKERAEEGIFQACKKLAMFGKEGIRNEAYVNQLDYQIGRYVLISMRNDDMTYSIVLENLNKYLKENGCVSCFEKYKEDLTEFANLKSLIEQEMYGELAEQ